MTISEEDRRLATLKLLLADGIPAFYTKRRALSIERRVQRVVALTLQGIYCAWGDIMKTLEEEERLLLETPGEEAKERLRRLRMIKEDFASGPIIRKKEG